MTKIWEAYVRIGKSVQGHERALLEEALDRIVAAPENEGIELLKKAKARNGDSVVPIVSRERVGTSVDLDDAQNPQGLYITMDFAQIANMRFVYNGAPSPVSVMGMLVHEAYHVADDKSYVVQTTLARLSFVQSGIGMDPLSDKEVGKIREEAQQALSDIRNNQFFSIDANAPYDANKYPALAAFSKRLFEEIDRKGQPNAHNAILNKIGALVNNFEKHEEDAVRYTDAFMQKSGCREPMRGTFTNSQPTEGKTSADAHNSVCSGLSPTKGFKATSITGFENLGDLEVPIIRPHQPERAPPTRFQ
jgi:hypothetical protein